MPEGRVYGGRGGEHVSMAERRQVAHGHVSSQGCRAEGGSLIMKAFGEFLVGVAAPLILFRFVGHFAVPRLYSLLLHGQRPVHLCKEQQGSKFGSDWSKVLLLAFAFSF